MEQSMNTNYRIIMDRNKYDTYYWWNIYSRDTGKCYVKYTNIRPFYCCCYTIS